MRKVRSPVTLDDPLGGCGRLRVLRFLAQVTVVLEPGCGSAEASRRGMWGGRARTHVLKGPLTRGWHMQEGAGEAAPL